jgi:hypothetical protein
MQSGIGETDWAFKTTFNASEDEVKAPHADLVFEGLDTYATVELVCQAYDPWPILQSNAYFLEWAQNTRCR